MDFLESSLDEIIEITSNEDKFSKKWFIEFSELDETQMEIYEDRNFNFVVLGCAGSGKSILALHKLFQILGSKSRGFDSYLFTVYTKALLIFFRDGLDIFLKENHENKDLYDLNIDESNIININRVDIDKIKESKEYLIVDEFQDIGASVFFSLKEKFNNVMLFGDFEQMLYDKENPIDRRKMTSIFGESLKIYELNKTYRLPYEIADFAGQIINSNIKNKCIEEESDMYLPNIIKCEEVGGEYYFKNEIEFVINQIHKNDLKDVGIMVHRNDSAQMVLDLVREQVEVVYSESDRDMPNICYKINEDDEELGFISEDSITILTFHSSKGTQFENVFVVKCDCKSIKSKKHNYDKALFVACTRTAKNLYITHSKQLTKFIRRIDSEKYKYYKYEEGDIKEIR